MAEIRPNEGESPEKVAKRFEILVRKEGVLSDVRSRSQFMSPSEKRRMKSKKAQKRLRKQERLARKFEPPDDKHQGWELLQQDIGHGWPINLNEKPPKSLYVNTRNTRFAREAKPAEEPSDYASVIFEYTNPKTGETGLVLVQNGPDKDRDEKKPGRFGFPGGSAKPGETLRQAGSRESFEETGFDVDLNCYESFQFAERIGNHTKNCFAGRIIGGTPQKGEEIFVLECRTVESLSELANMGYLRSFHRRAFEAWLEWRKSR